MEYDLHSIVFGIPCVTPSALTNGTNGAPVDTLGFESIEYIIHVGEAMVGGGFNITIQQAPDDGTGSPGVFVGVPSDLILGVLPIVSIGDADKIFRVGSVGKDRHQRIVLVENGTITAGTIAASAILGHPKTAPTAAQNT